MSRNRFIIVAILVAVAGFAWWSVKPSNAPIEAVEVPLKPGQIKLAGMSAGYNAAQSSSLESLATDAIRVYSNGSWNDFFKLRESQGLPVDENMRKISQTVTWEEMTAVLRGAEMSQPEIRQAVVNGKVQNETPTVGRMMTTMAGGMNPARGEKDITDAVGIGADVVEVIVPARMRAKNETGELRFAGKFCILMAKRPTDQNWIVIGLRIRDAPPARVVLPPI